MMILGVLTIGLRLFWWGIGCSAKDQTKKEKKYLDFQFNIGEWN